VCDPEEVIFGGNIRKEDPAKKVRGICGVHFEEGLMGFF